MKFLSRLTEWVGGGGLWATDVVTAGVSTGASSRHTGSDGVSSRWAGV